ncbi:hypothetical protein GCM10027060_26480 [Nesterenkonia halophila]
MTDNADTAPPAVSNWPVVQIALNEDGTGVVTIAGSKTPITAADESAARAQALAIVAERARDMKRPLRAWTADPSGRWPLIVHMDGTVEQDTSRPAEPADGEGLDDQILGEPDSADPHAGDLEEAVEADHLPSDTEADEPVAETAISAEQATSRRERRDQRESFLTTQRREQPATRGWRGALASLGIRVSPSTDERAEREDQRLVSQHWPGPRTIAVVNGKGGASKTPSTVLLSAVFARAGSQVIAWDNNQTRGTLGWRTEQAGHASTVLDMLPDIDRLLGTNAQSADLAHFVHHQPADKFDVLRSQPMRLASEQRVHASDVARVHQALAKYYRLLIMDSGNDESDPMWLRMIELADQIVVATTTRADHAEAGALLLDSLADSDDPHSRHLADTAVAVVSQAEPKAPAGDLSRIAEGYRGIARDVVQIPFDPAIVDGHLSFEALRPSTQRAWLRAAAAVASGL